MKLVLNEGYSFLVSRSSLLCPLHRVIWCKKSACLKQSAIQTVRFIKLFHKKLTMIFPVSKECFCFILERYPVIVCRSYAGFITFILVYQYLLTLLWERFLSYRNQSIDLQSKLMVWFLYDMGLRHERVKLSGNCGGVFRTNPVKHSAWRFLWKY